MTTTMIMTNSGATTTASVASITNCRMSAIRLNREMVSACDVLAKIPRDLFGESVTLVSW